MTQASSALASLRTSVIAGVRWNAAGTTILIGLQGLQLVVLSRMLPPADFGLMAMCTVVIAFAESLSAAGTGNYIIHRQSTSTALLATSTALNLIVGLGIALAVFLGAPLLADVFNEPRLILLVRTLACATFISAIGVVPDQILRRELEFKTLVTSQVVAMAMATAVSITMAAAGAGVMSLVMGFVTRTSAATALVTLATWRKMDFGRQFRMSRKELGHLLRFGAPQLSQRLLDIASERVDVALVGATMGAEMLGHYAFALSLVTIPQTRINPIATAVALPAFSKLQDDRTILGTAFCRVLRAVTAINAPLLLGLVVSAPVAIPLAFGDKWMSTIPIVQFLSLVGLGRAVGNPVGCLLVATGAVWRAFVWTVGCVSVTIVVVYTSCVTTGTPSGVAFGLGLIQLPLILATYLFLVRPTTKTIWCGYIDSIGRPVTAAAVSAVFAWLPSFVFERGAVLVVIQVAAFIAAYRVALQAIDPASLRELMTLLRRNALRTDAMRTITRE
jgi:O-antigen/teichoic acid export membrane protein